MNPPLNPFHQRIVVYNDPDVLRKGLAANAVPIAGLENLPVHAAKRRLEEHLQSVYVPTESAIKLAERILSSAYVHALNAYPDIPTFITTSTQDRIVVTTEPEVWVITGLAGDGKTALITALRRLMGEGELYQASQNCPKRRIQGAVFLTLHSKMTKGEVIKMLSDWLGLELDCERVQPVHLDKIRLELYRQGCCFILADEAQSNAAGKGAGASYANLINLLRQFGLPVIVIGNYSMCHALLKQASQNRQRLLHDPFVMPTIASDDPDYIAHLREYVIASNGLLTFDVEKDAGRIHWLTFGGGRALLHLISVAYRLQREKGGGAPTQIDLQALEAAFGHESYSAHRVEIDKLRAHWLSKAKISEDLEFPFPMGGEREVAHQKMVQQLRQEARAAGMLVGTMTPKERKDIAQGITEGPQFVASPVAAIAAEKQGSKIEERTAPFSEVGSNLMKDMLSPKKRSVRRPPPSVEDLNRSWGS